MQERQRVYPIQLVLHCDDEALRSSLYCEGFEARAEVELPPELLSEYQLGLSLATEGVATAGEPLRPVVDTMVSVAIPDNARQHLRKLAKEALQGRLVALEVRILDSALEAYPWELLSYPGGLLPKEVDIAIWRNVDSARRPTKDLSDSALLVGSAPIDSGTPHPYKELELIVEGIGTHSGIIPHPHPMISFGEFRRLLSRLQPAVLHLVVHGDVKSFRFQDDSNPGWSIFQESQHADIHYREFVDDVKRSTATTVVVLDACDSASARGEQSPVARQLAIAGHVTVIGMAGKLPVRVGMAFSHAFHHNLAHGTSIIDAFSAGVRSIRNLPSPDADFWSIPVVYSAQPNVVVFPADLDARVRRALRQVQALQSDIDELPWEPAWRAGDWAEHTAALGVRLDHVRHALPSLSENQPARRGSLLRRLSLHQACQSLEWLLAGTADCLQQLADPDTPDRDRPLVIQRLQAQRPQLVSTLTELDLFVNGSA